MVKVPFTCNSTGDLLSRLRGYNDWFTNVFQQGETPLNRRRHAIRLQSADIVSLLLSVRWTPTVDACLWLYSEWYPWLVNYYCNLNLLPPPSVSFFKDLLWFVLSNSFIHFDETDEYFLQTSGVAMGSCISVFVANCYV